MIIGLALMEWNSFYKSGKSSILLLATLSILWAATIVWGESTELTHLWILFFSYILSAGVVHPVFIRERLAGAFEILLISGLSRLDFVGGKILFSVAITFLMGALSLLLSLLFQSLAVGESWITIDLIIPLALFFLLCCFSVCSLTALLSFALSHPRLVSLLTMGVLVSVSILTSLLDYFFEVGILSLIVLLLAITSLSLALLPGVVRRESLVEPLVY